MKRPALVIFSLVLSLLLPLTALAEGLTLRTVSIFAGADAAADTYTHLLKEWEEKTGNRVSDVSTPSNEEWKTGVLLDFAAGNEADVLFYFVGTADSAPILSRVVPIAEINAACPELQLPESELCREADGAVYAIPVREYWEGLFCNKDLFDLYGLELPTTWEKLETAARVFRENGVVPLAVSLSDQPHYIAEFCLLCCGGEEAHRQRPASIEEVPGSWTKGMALLRQMQQEGFFPEDTEIITASEASQLFLQKKAAMQIDGSWFANSLPEDRMDSTVVLPFPSRNGDSSAIIRGVSMGFYLTRKAWNSPRRDAAVDLLRYLATGSNARALGGYGFTGALLKSADAMLASHPERLSPVQDAMSPEARTLWFRLIPSLADGRVTPEELWRQVMALRPFQRQE